MVNSKRIGIASLACAALLLISCFLTFPDLASPTMLIAYAFTGFSLSVLDAFAAIFTILALIGMLCLIAIGIILITEKSKWIAKLSSFLKVGTIIGYAVVFGGALITSFYLLLSSNVSFGLFVYMLGCALSFIAIFPAYSVVKEYRLYVLHTSGL